ncbi:Origin recognition complex, subunit 1 [Mycoemilia scoparia]|uniref:Origin recognition complex subunit 1 n=1 Tax=Mycoemilia scoparia TaxID=417184 RepID=A0A9W8A768_9FUNG|nr:Origin recognition complex, subunit 1 [Mycoemilia scoparia]
MPGSVKRTPQIDNYSASVKWGKRILLEDESSQNDAPSTPSEGLTPRRYNTRKLVSATQYNINRDYYQSMYVNGQEFKMGQAVAVNSGDENKPYLGIIYKMYEDEIQRKRILMRWLYQLEEVLSPLRSAQKNKIKRQFQKPDFDDQFELFYTNSDDIIDPEDLICGIKVCSVDKFRHQFPNGGENDIPDDLYGQIYCCRWFYNESTSHFGELEWDVFYNEGNGPFLNMEVDDNMFKLKEPKFSTPVSTPSRRKATTAKSSIKRSQSVKASKAKTKTAADMDVDQDENDGLGIEMRPSKSHPVMKTTTATTISAARKIISINERSPQRSTPKRTTVARRPRAIVDLVEEDEDFVKEVLGSSSEESVNDDDEDGDYVYKPPPKKQEADDMEIEDPIEEEPESPPPQPHVPVAKPKAKNKAQTKVRTKRGTGKTAIAATAPRPRQRKSHLPVDILATPQTQRRKRLLDVQPLPECGTPLARRLFSKSGTFVSPSIQEGATAYEIARQRLHVSAVPDSLPCRENEFADILMHLQSALEEQQQQIDGEYADTQGETGGGSGMCLYISGVPGAGKTATVREVVRTLQESADQGELAPFQYVELNGMKMTEPAQAYSMLWQAICSQNGEKDSKGGGLGRVTNSHAAQLLDEYFSNSKAKKRTTSSNNNNNIGNQKRQSLVVLMDELDLLVTKNQSVIYNFFEWPYRKNSGLIVIAIANTMDLPERMLSHKVSSRLGLTRINFQPYTHQQLYTIVTSRLEGCEAFDPDAIELCARKISAVSGDARRVLDVCRRAVEMVETEWIQAKKEEIENNASNNKNNNNRSSVPRGEEDNPFAVSSPVSSLISSKPKATLKQVTMRTIDQAVKEMYNSSNIAFVTQASLHQKMFMVSLRAALRKVGLPEVTFGEIAIIHQQYSQMYGLEIPTFSDLFSICTQLSASRYILAESNQLDVHQKVRLNFPEDDVVVALKPDPLFRKIVA